MKNKLTAITSWTSAGRRGNGGGGHAAEGPEDHALPQRFRAALVLLKKYLEQEGAKARMVPWFGKQTPFSVAQLIAYRLMGYRTLNINWMPFNHRHQMRLVRGLCGILGVHVIWTIHDLSPHSVRFGSREADEAATTDEGNSCVLVRNGENENISNDTGEIAARLRDIYRSRAKDMGERPPEIAEAYSWDARRSPIRRCSIMSWRRERREHAFHAPS